MTTQGQPRATYHVYRWHDLGQAPISKLREVGRVWGIDNWETKTRTELRWSIMRHDKNVSLVPHPLIDIPVEL